MVGIILALVIITYLSILCGLTIWLGQYHYIKNKFFINPSIDETELHLAKMEQETESGHFKKNHHR